MTTPQPIEFHRLALLRVLLALFAFVGIEPGGAGVERLPKPVRLMVLRVLLPAESAARRLALYLSRRVAAEMRAMRPVRRGRPRQCSGPGSLRAPSFWLFDSRPHMPELSDRSRKPRTGPGPRVWLLDGSDPVPEPVAEKTGRDPRDATRLCRRMEALRRALEDLPTQARRLRRAMEVRAEAPPGHGRYGPVRPGWPPGYRRRHTHEVDGVLADCHAMVWHDRGPPDP